MAKLSKRLIDSITASEKDVVVWDDSLSGFGIRAKPSGVKSFLIQYRNRNGRSRRLSIGQVGKMTLDQARKAAIRSRTARTPPKNGRWQDAARALSSFASST